MALIEHNQQRYPKKLITPNELGHTPQIIKCKDAYAQALQITHEISRQRKEGILLKDMAIIYRTNIQARPIVETFLAANIPFCLRDGMVSLYEQWITKDILSYLHLSQSPGNLEDATRIINKPKRYISKAIIERTKNNSTYFLRSLLEQKDLTAWQQDYIQQLLFDLQILKEKSLLEAIHYIRHHIGYDHYLKEYASYRKMPVENLYEILEDIQDSAAQYSNLEEWERALCTMSQQIKERKSHHSSDLITLTTMHGAKGLEFHTVFIIDVVEGTIPYHKSLNSNELEEERRLLYVGMTRAKQNLLLFVPEEKHNKSVAPSCFLNEIHSTLAQVHFVPGQWLTHKRMGRGKILEILPHGILKVQFLKGEIRKIDSNYCLSNDIITWEDKAYEK